ncbi:hypothetical protein EXIGLDRAFT_769475 [Exidia glandulosa HHB12029]|uniref:F-box domain-containing protein n=1 Tax=Exidia glandulosa HHB12029 TaxID=1314781 RepID=A0A165HF82_EXIGL|nr:hypothetical protein EXIGLDRAFT_769475 [Exidia glandulosa HHB12029]
MSGSAATQHLQQQLLPGATSVFSSALQLLGRDLDDASAVENLALEARNIVQSALASVLREYNLRFSLWRRLPDELWCMIWRDLPMNDRMRVSHVCSAWRKLAVSTPHIWRSLEVVSERIRSGPQCKSKACPSVQERNNMQLVSLLLKRSLRIPLHMRVLITWPDQAIMGDLAKLLLRHVARLEVLHFDTVDGNMPQEFLDYFLNFPSLRTLTCISSPPPQLHGSRSRSHTTEDTVRFVLPPISAPQLHTLRTGGPLMFEKDDDDKAILLPSVTTFETTIAEPADLTVALLAYFPRLQHLSIRFAPHASWERDFRASGDVVEELSRIPSFSASEVHALNEPLVMDLLRASRRSALSVTYTDRYANTPRAYELCADVKRSAQLTCHPSRGENVYEMVTFAVVTEDGLRRDIGNCYPINLDPIWKHLDSAWVTSLSVGAEQWRSLLWYSTPPLSSLQLLEIALPRKFDLASLPTNDAGGAVSPPQFDSLEVLRLVDVEGRGVSVKAKALAKFVRYLRHGQDLKVLALRRVSQNRPVTLNASDNDDECAAIVPARRLPTELWISIFNLAAATPIDSHNLTAKPSRSTADYTPAQYAASMDARRVFCLICRQLYGPASTLLFRFVWLHKRGQARRLAQALQGRPQLGSLIRRLDVDTSSNPAAILVSALDVRDILLHTTGLITFIDNCSTYTNVGQHDAQYSAMMPELSSLCRDTLRHLHVSCYPERRPWTALVEPFTLCPSLHTLEIDFSTNNGSAVQSAATAQLPLHFLELRVLEITLSSTHDRAMNQVLSAVAGWSLPRLETMRLLRTIPDGPGILQIVAAHGARLLRLDLGTLVSARDVVATNAPNLRKLSITVRKPADLISYALPPSHLSLEEIDIHNVLPATALSPGSLLGVFAAHAGIYWDRDAKPSPAICDGAVGQLGRGTETR